jgi:hypothetical protein
MDIPNACVVEMPIHKGPVLSVRFNHSGDYCLSCGADRVVKLLNPHKGLLIKTYRCRCCAVPAAAAADRPPCSGHSQDVRTAVASHDNSRLASGGNDRVPMVPPARAQRRAFAQAVGAGVGRGHRPSHSPFKGVRHEGQLSTLRPGQHAHDRRQRRPQRKQQHSTSACPASPACGK